MSQILKPMELLSGTLRPVPIPNLVAFPQKCVAFGSGIHSCIAGCDTSFEIGIHDERDRHVGFIGGEKCDAFIEDSKGQRYSAKQIEDRRDGTFFISYALSEAGHYLIHATINGELIRGSPFPIVCKTARTCPLQTIVSGSALTHTRAGLSSSIQLQTCDEFGNLCVFGGANICVVIQDGSRPLATATIIDRGTGSYEAQYLLSKAGTLSLHITVNGENVRGSPFRLVSAPDIAASNTSTAIDLQRGLSINTDCCQLIQLRDKYGNAADSAATRVKATLSGPRFVQALVEPREHGKCAVLFMLTAPGHYQLKVALSDGKPIAGSPFMIFADDEATTPKPVPRGTRALPVYQGVEFLDTRLVTPR